MSRNAQKIKSLVLYVNPDDKEKMLRRMECELENGTTLESGYEAERPRWWQPSFDSFQLFAVLASYWLVRSVDLHDKLQQSRTEQDPCFPTWIKNFAKQACKSRTAWVKNSFGQRLFKEVSGCAHVDTSRLESSAITIKDERDESELDDRKVTEILLGLGIYVDRFLASQPALAILPTTASALSDLTAVSQTVAADPVGPTPAPPVSANKIDPKELGPLLGYYRRSIGLKDKTLEQRWSEARKKPTTGSWIPEGWELFEQGHSADAPQTLSALKSLLELYAPSDSNSDMPRLMAEWLLSVPSNPNLVWNRIGDFQNPYEGQTPDSPWYGIKCSYAIPPVRLQGAECSFVRVNLKPVGDDLLQMFEQTAKELNLEARLNRGGFLSTRDLDEIPSVTLPTGACVRPRDLIPHSAPHRHPGDEMILCTKGMVIVVLEDSGTRTRLQKGDYIHFAAEIPHSAINVSIRDDAEILVVRFFQAARIGSRRSCEEDFQYILDQLKRPLPFKVHPSAEIGLQLSHSVKEVAGRFEDLWTRYMRIEPWLFRQLQSPMSPVDRQPDEVCDYVGLSRLLQLCIVLDNRNENAVKLLKQFLGASRKDMKGGDLSELRYQLREIAKEIEQESRRSERSSEWIERVLHGERLGKGRAATVEDLQIFADFFRIPRVLLDNCLLPAVPRSVAVRANDCDRIDPPRHIPTDRASGAEYKLPCRALADSDIAVTFLDLPKGRSSPLNRHSGCEFTLCLEGAAKVTLWDGNPNLDHNKHIPELSSSTCAKDEYVHYRSDKYHKVENVANGRTKLLIIRFNEIFETDLVRAVENPRAPNRAAFPTVPDEVHMAFDAKTR